MIFQPIKHISYTKLAMPCPTQNELTTQLYHYFYPCLYDPHLPA